MAAPNLTVSDTPPTAPLDNDLWWNSATGFLFIYYNDGNTAQWVSCNPAVGKQGEKGPPGNAAFIGTFKNVPIAAGGIELDVSLNQVFNVVVNGTLNSQTVLNADPTVINVILVQFTGDGTQRQQTWNWTWLTGKPVLSFTAGKRDLAVIFSPDGANWFATMYAQYF